ncbi:hypothetical protein JXA47_00910 [Candidatus Sumerlaeota bacterium]|nr:hypothetical protein [Candidatus Sumerlaeota bacterium]
MRRCVSASGSFTGAIGWSIRWSMPREALANIITRLIHQTNHLLDRQIRQLEQAFLREGGLRERMTRARLASRGRDRRRR